MLDFVEGNVKLRLFPAPPPIRPASQIFDVETSRFATQIGRWERFSTLRIA